MKNIRKSTDRGEAETSWLKSQHSFSFGEYYDKNHMGFGPLRVINEDWVAPDAGFGMHGHKNMEILTYVLSGVLAHKDSLGTGADIRPGEIQLMSAGSGIMHSEINPSSTDTTHLLQIWIMPDALNTQPSYQQKPFARTEMQGVLRPIATPDGREGSLVIKSSASVYAGILPLAGTLKFPTQEKRKYWVQVACGGVDFAQTYLTAGDGLAIEKETGILTFAAAEEGTEVLLFDLPA